MRWFRMYSEVLNDEKVLMLDYEQRWLWVALLALASESSERGVIHYRRISSLAILLRVTEESLRTTLDILSDLNMIEHAEQRIGITHWDDRQYDKPSDTPERVTSRVRKHRAAKRNGDGNADETPGNAIEERRGETEAETETEPEGALPRPAPAPVPPGELVTVFLEAIGKADRRVPAAYRTTAERHCTWLVGQGFGVDQFARYLAYRKLRGQSMELRWICEDILQWAAEGEPDMPPTRPPPRTGPRPISPEEFDDKYAHLFNRASEH